MTEDLTKLPKWAEQEITRLRADLEYLQRKLQSVGVDAESLITSNPYSETPVHLPDDRIRFRFSGSERRFIDVTRCEAPDRLEIHADTLVSGLVIIPQASNLINAVLLPREVVWGA